MWRNPQERARRFGKVIELRKCRIDFLPIDELNLAAAAASPSPPRKEGKKKLTKIEPTKTELTKIEPTRSKPTKSELTTATKLIVEFLRKNVAADKWGLFFREFIDPVGPSIAALLKRNQPKLPELRPLDAAFIDECAPKEIPEDPWNHLKVCLEWFIYWSRRVIPVAVYPEAMLQAKKTLAPQDLFLTVDGRC